MRHIHKRQCGTEAAHNDALGNRGNAEFARLLWRIRGTTPPQPRASRTHMAPAFPLFPLFPLFSFLRRIRATGERGARCAESYKRISLRFQSDKRDRRANSSSPSIPQANARVRCRADRCAAPPAERHFSFDERLQFRGLARTVTARTVSKCSVPHRRIARCGDSQVDIQTRQ
jgi:hypothetical protein